MRGIVGWYRGWSLASRQFLYLFLVTSAMVAFLAYTNYNRAVELFKNQIVDDAKKLMVRSNQFLDTYLDNGQNILWLMNSKVEFMKAGEEKETQTFLRLIGESNSNTAKTLYMMRSDGKVYCSNQVVYEVIGNPMLGKLLEMSRQNNGAAIVSQPYVSPISGPTVAIARALFDGNNVWLGVAVVELDLEKLNRKVAEMTVDGNQTFALLSDKGLVVTYDSQSDLLPSKPRTYKQELPDDYVAHLSDLPIGATEETGSQGGLVTVKSSQNRLGWTLFLFIKEKYFYQNIAKLYDNYKSAALFMVLVLLLTAFSMSRVLTRPIRTLAAKMDRVRNMELLPSISVHRGDEIGRLTRSFNSMMERIRGLHLETKQMEARKKELELKVLQSQIAPHFLYNTLACIGSLARQNRTSEVRETIRALVGVLKFSFDRTSEFVRAEDELEGLHQYLQIQKTRYGDKFASEVAAASEALPCSMLKLTLQPIVENAIFHGIVPSGRRGLIKIRAEVRSGVLRLVVRDNGVGMAPEHLRKVIGGRITKASKERFTGIGLHNVQDRLRIHYGEPFGLRIRSVREVGTVVVIRIPAQPLREHLPEPLEREA